MLSLSFGRNGEGLWIAGQDQNVLLHDLWISGKDRNVPLHDSRSKGVRREMNKNIINLKKGYIVFSVRDEG